MLESIENSTVWIRKNELQDIELLEREKTVKKYIICVCLYFSDIIKGFFCIKRPSNFRRPTEGVISRCFVFFSEKMVKNLNKFRNS